MFFYLTPHKRGALILKPINTQEILDILCDSNERFYADGKLIECYNNNGKLRNVQIVGEINGFRFTRTYSKDDVIEKKNND